MIRPIFPTAAHTYPSPLFLLKTAQAEGFRHFYTGHFGDLLFSGQRYWSADLRHRGRWLSLLRQFDRKDFFYHGLLALLPHQIAQWNRVKTEKLEGMGFSAEFITRSRILDRIHENKKDYQSKILEQAKRLQLLICLELWLRQVWHGDQNV